MRMRFGVPLAIILTGVYTAAMITLNNVTNAATATPVVAGVSTERFLTHIPETEQAVTTTVNVARVAGGQSNLVEDTRLNALAQARVIDMVSRRYYAHTTPDGTDFADMLTTFGLSATTPSCENLLLTASKNPTTMTREWLASSSHEKCLLDQSKVRIGVAEGVFDQSTGQTVVVTIFASGVN